MPSNRKSSSPKGHGARSPTLRPGAAKEGDASAAKASAGKTSKASVSKRATPRPARTTKRRARGHPVLVFGMHRSGTSLTARVLNLLGLTLGREPTMLPRRFDNAAGYWEQEPIMRVNDAILEALGGSWNNPPKLPAGWHEDDRLLPLKEEAIEALRDCGLETSGRFVVKDPRLSLTLPFWLDLFHDVRCVVCMRNPLEVVASSITRDPQTVTAEATARHWLRYTAHALEQSADQPRLLTFYEDYFERLDEEVVRLARFVRGDRATVSRRARREIGEFVDQTLRHHVIGLDQLASTNTLAAESRALYLAARGTRSLAVAGDGEHVAPEVFADSLAPVARGLLGAYAERQGPQGGERGPDRNEFERITRELDQLRTALTEREAQLKRTRDELRKERESAETSRAELERRSVELEHARSDLSRERQSGGEAQSELEQRSSQLDQRTRKLEQAHNELRAERQTAEAAQRELAERGSQLEERTKELQELRIEHQRVVSELEQRRSQLEASQREVQSTREVIEQAQEELQERGAQLEARSTELEQIGAELSEERTSAEKAREELDEMKADRDRRRGQLEAQRADLTSLRSELSRARMELERLRDPVALSSPTDRT